MKLIPTPIGGHPHTRVRVALGGATYTIRWLWNERGGTWSFSMWDPDGAPLVMGMRVVLNVDLLASVPPGDHRPPHRIVVFDPSGDLAEPTRESLGSRVKILYTEPEVAA